MARLLCAKAISQVSDRIWRKFWESKGIGFFTPSRKKGLLSGICLFHICPAVSTSEVGRTTTEAFENSGIVGNLALR